MRWSRRDFLMTLGAAGVTPVWVSGCGSSGSGIPPLPENLPEYEFSGTPGPATMFEHGVASGDPEADAIVLWTRVSPGITGSVEVWWEMALDADFTQRVAQGTLDTDESRDFTAKVDVRELVWGRNYYYRFFAVGRQSPIGRTRLAPIGNDAKRARFALASCSSLAHGFFHSYGRMAERADLDFVLHVGDYIYEYGNGEFGSAREYEPPTEILSLGDYRMRYSQYRREPELQELHRQNPFINVWDDHESANDSFKDGAENHQPETEGEWSVRKMVSAQVFFEWLPIRDNPMRRIWRTLPYGDLFDLILLDTRIHGRGPRGPIVVNPDQPGLSDQILGEDQETWLQDQLMQSTARWRMIGQQVAVGLFIDGMGQYLNGDAWSGYPAARDRFLNFIGDNNIDNVVVLTGDIHSSWCMDLVIDDGRYTSQDRSASVAVEFVCPGITSPSDANLSGLQPTILANSPHVRYSDVQKNGHVILDVTEDRVQADWYHVDGVAEGEGAESVSASWAVRDGQTVAEKADGPASDNDDFIPLAPA